MNMKKTQKVEHFKQLQCSQAHQAAHIEGNYVFSAEVMLGLIAFVYIELV